MADHPLGARDDASPNAFVDRKTEYFSRLKPAKRVHTWASLGSPSCAAVQFDTTRMNLPIDPQNLSALLVGVSSNALWSLIAHLGGRAVAAVERRFASTSIVNMYAESAAAAAAELAGTPSDQLKLRRFLSSPDVESIVRQIYATNLLPSSGDRLSEIESEFTSALARHLDVDDSRAAAAAAALFRAILSECDARLSIAVESNVLAAHDLKSNARHQRLLGELAAIKRNIEILSKAPKLEVQALLAFEEKYRTQVADRHRHLQPPQLETARRFPIDELYVTPTFLSQPKKQMDPARLSLDAFPLVSGKVLCGIR